MDDAGQDRSIITKHGATLATGATGGAAAGPNMALVAYHRDGTQVISLEAGRDVVVGRAPPSDVIIADVGLSRQHARFTLAQGEVIVEDLGSTNGTVLAGEPIERAVLHPGDEVILGGVTVTLHNRRATSTGRVTGHERFRAALADEIVRARHFQRPVSVLHARASGAGSHVRLWASKIEALLTPVDRVGIYSDTAVEILLPETALADGVAWARKLVALAAGEPRLRVGVGAFPDSATSVEALLGDVRAAIPAASASDPIGQVGDGPRSLSSKSSASPPNGPIAHSEAMRTLLQTAARVAKGSIPVLILGETGTGTEVLSRYVHEASSRRERPLLCVNCAAIPSQLLESALFGHERGAFTGATSQHTGVFEAADGGTVFLDEVGELPAQAQAALLRVLETKRFTRVGSTKEIAVNVRILAATHRDLGAMVEEGRFRQDLLYRLNALTLEVPSLRQHPEDIPALCEHFLSAANEANGCSVRGIDPEALELMCAHAWPGNVRELRNVIDRAVVIAEGEWITVDDLPASVRDARTRAAPPSPATRPPASTQTDTIDLASVTGDFRSRIERLEADLLVHCLREAGWNQTETARRLNMPLRTLVHKIKVHGIKKPVEADPAIGCLRTCRS